MSIKIGCVYAFCYAFRRALVYITPHALGVPRASVDDTKWKKVSYTPHPSDVILRTVTRTPQVNYVHFGIAVLLGRRGL